MDVHHNRAELLKNLVQAHDAMVAATTVLAGAKQKVAAGFPHGIPLVYEARLVEVAASGEVVIRKLYPVLNDVSAEPTA